MGSSPPSRSHVYVRPLDSRNPADVAAFVAGTEQAGRDYPSRVFELPTTGVMVAEKREPHGIEIIGFQPHFPSLVLGSITWMGVPSPIEMAFAMRQFTSAAYTRAHVDRLAELVMFTSTPETATFAARHGYSRKHDAYSMEVR